jgi:serine/threonine-protein kinase
VSDERYRLVEKIGQGGMATVWRAEDRTLGRTVAVKRLLPGLGERGEAAERFAREARVLAGIRHANVLQLHDYLPAEGEEPARLVMELLSGPSLQRFVVDAGAPLPEVAALLGAEVAAGLSAAHAREIVHRDVKPENVILDAGRVVLTDFGVARVAASERSALTHTGAIIGSPTYMSPEQARGEEVDARSDQFSFGAMIYFLATGAAPFSASHPLAVMQKIEQGVYQPLGARNPRVPGWLDRVVHRCLQHAPSARYANVDALATALAAGLADDGFADAAAELRRYFADPPAYNAALPARIVAARIERAERAFADGDRARSLACIERVLQLDDQHPRARALLQRLERGVRRARVAALVGACALLAVGGWAGARALRHGMTPPPVPVLAAMSVPPAASAVSVAPAKDAPVAVLPTPAIAKPPSKRSSSAHVIASVASAPPIIAPAPAEAPPPPPPPTTTTTTTAPAPPVPSAAPAVAKLIVRTAPWCNLSVDGKLAGRTPQTLSLPPGKHALVCENPSGARLERNVELTPGAELVVQEALGSALLTPVLTRGDSIVLDADAASPAARHAVPGRHRVTLLRAGATLEARWIDLPPGGCRLVDSPALSCEGP